jgi:uncharacterized membrane protein YfhO
VLQRRPSVPEPTVEVVTYEPDHVVLEVHAPEAGYVVLTDAWYPGWQAEVSPIGASATDTSAPVMRADVLFRAVPVQAGAWRIRLRYRPAVIAWGGIASVAGILGWGGYTVWMHRRKGDVSDGVGDT